MEQLRTINKEYKDLIDTQRKMHEQAVRESKDLMGLINKIKTNGQQRTGSLDELLKECNTMIAGKDAQSMHPVFIELNSQVSGADQSNLNPWSEANRSKLSVLHL